MEHILTREFSISRDWKNVAWGATLWHNTLRAACAGLVWCVLILVFSDPKRAGGTPPYLLPILFPIFYLLIYLPIGLVCVILSRVLPFVGIIALMIGLFFAIPGDPLIWLLSLVVPKAVPAEKPGFLNFALIMWILKPEDAVEITLTNTNTANKL